MIRLLRLIPTPFWFYFLPMLASTFGVLPKQSPLYGILSRQLLPVCLVLLLIGTDLKETAKLGRTALLLMLAGAAGTVAGGLISFSLFQRWLPPEAWGGIGALSASWTGGSVNLLAVKEALQLPDGLVGPLIIVDAAVAYSWMGLLIWSSSLQEKWNVAIGASTSSARTESPTVRTEPVEVRTLLLPVAITLAVFLSLAAQWVAVRLPVPGPAISVSTWTVLIVTTAALLLSLTPLRKLEQAGASRAGTFFLYILLITIGAQADLRSLLHAPVFLALGGVWILIHGAAILAAGWALRAPLGLIAAASQANIGGTVSAPIVGATFSARFASAGLLMAVLGNVFGTYIGLLSAGMARALTSY